MHTVDLIARIRAVLGTPKIGTDTEIRTTPTLPYYLVTATPGLPEARRLTHHAPDRLAVFYVMAVNNSPTGALHLADRAVGLLDGHRLEPEDPNTGPLEASYVGPVIDAGDAPGDWRWSVTVEFRHHTSGGIHANP